MKIFIIEDEELAVKKLQKTIQSVEENIEIIGTADSIKSSVEWLQSNPVPDLILMDIELLDGQSFEIFNRVEVKSPVIFTTSYDEFALKAFKVNSIDYLLKPVQKEDLKSALDKYKKIHQHNGPQPLNIDSLLKELQQQLQPVEYRKRFLVKHANKMVSIETADIAYFYSDNGLNFFMSKDNKRYMLDYLMDEIENMLNPQEYFRVSRSLLVSIHCIDKIEDYFGNRLVLKIKPDYEKEAIVSREKVSEFKKWMGK
ncbi:LytTR family DNA-binding domain-containing protein [soil metagenome]